MTRKPLIAISPSYSSDRKVRLSHEYLDALLLCDVIPVTLPYTEDSERLRAYAEEFDAFLFSGGVDVDPSYYGEEKQFDSVEIDAERDRFEIPLLHAALGTGKPILGICRGMQLLNIALGGTLLQHMEGHRQKEPNPIPSHAVQVADPSRLRAIVGTDTISVNSFHHQAVKAVAPSLRASAYADDGTVEAIESDSHPFLVGVQWHPELMHAATPHAMAIFRAFTDAAKLG